LHIAGPQPAAHHAEERRVLGERGSGVPARPGSGVARQQGGHDQGDAGADQRLDPAAGDPAGHRRQPRHADHDHGVHAALDRGEVAAVEEPAQKRADEEGKSDLPPADVEPGGEELSDQDAGRRP
jgi:hypothetical protein